MDCPAVRLAVDGAIETEAGALRMMVAEAVFVVSAALVAVTVMELDVTILAGAR
jgi:hypothetical protein